MSQTSRRESLLALAARCGRDCDWPAATRLYPRILRVLQARPTDRDALWALDSVVGLVTRYRAAASLIPTLEDIFAGLSPRRTRIRSLLALRLGSIRLVTGRDLPRGFDLVQLGHALALDCGDRVTIAQASLAHGFALTLPFYGPFAAEEVLTLGLQALEGAGEVRNLRAHLEALRAYVRVLRGEPAAALELVPVEGCVEYVESAIQSVRAFALAETEEFEASRNVLDRIIQRFVPVQIRPHLHATMARVHLGRSEHGHAMLAAKAMQDALSELGGGIYQPMAQVSHARFLRRAGRGDEATALLRQVAEQNADVMPFWAVAARELDAGRGGRVEKPRILALGGLRIEIGGREIQMRHGNAQKLLKVLLALHDRAATSDVVADWLWPEGRGPEGMTPRTIKQSCHLLRRELNERADLPSDVLRQSDGNWRLNPERITIDVIEFENCARAALRHRAAGETLRSVGLARRAASLYVGPFLGTEDLSPEMLGRRVELDELSRSATILLIEACVGDAEQAVAWCEARLSVAPQDACALLQIVERTHGPQAARRVREGFKGGVNSFCEDSKSD